MRCIIDAPVLLCDCACAFDLRECLAVVIRVLGCVPQRATRLHADRYQTLPFPSVVQGRGRCLFLCVCLCVWSLCPILVIQCGFLKKKKKNKVPLPDLAPPAPAGRGALLAARPIRDRSVSVFGCFYWR